MYTCHAQAGRQRLTERETKRSPPLGLCEKRREDERRERENDFGEGKKTERKRGGREDSSNKRRRGEKREGRTAAAA